MTPHSLEVHKILFAGHRVPVSRVAVKTGLVDLLLRAPRGRTQRVLARDRAPAHLAWHDVDAVAATFGPRLAVRPAATVNKGWAS